ncbi:hypothetical protein ACTXT7_015793 [Hymenolepis weldensis]
MKERIQHAFSLSKSKGMSDSTDGLDRDVKTCNCRTFKHLFTEEVDRSDGAYLLGMLSKQHKNVQFGQADG